MSRIPFRKTCHAINFDYLVLMFEYLRTSQPVIMTKDIPMQISNLPVISPKNQLWMGWGAHVKNTIGRAPLKTT